MWILYNEECVLIKCGAIYKLYDIVKGSTICTSLIKVNRVITASGKYLYIYNNPNNNKQITRIDTDKIDRRMLCEVLRETCLTPTFTYKEAIESMNLYTGVLVDKRNNILLFNNIAVRAIGVIRFGASDVDHSFMEVVNAYLEQLESKEGVEKCDVSFSNGFIEIKTNIEVTKFKVMDGEEVAETPLTVSPPEDYKTIASYPDLLGGSILAKYLSSSLFITPDKTYNADTDDGAFQCEYIRGNYFMYIDHPSFVSDLDKKAKFTIKFDNSNESVLLLF